MKRRFRDHLAGVEHRAVPDAAQLAATDFEIAELLGLGEGDIVLNGVGVLPSTSSWYARNCE